MTEREASYGERLEEQVAVYRDLSDAELIDILNSPDDAQVIGGYSALEREAATICLKERGFNIRSFLNPLY